MSRNIPASERLPKESDEYLVSVIDEYDEKRDWKDAVKDDPRYKGFTLSDNPVPFREQFKEDIPVVQLHAILTPCGVDIIGFCGVFKWEKGKVIPLDHDYYTDTFLVLGYEWFEHNGEQCLDVLVGDDW